MVVTAVNGVKIGTHNVAFSGKKEGREDSLPISTESNISRNLAKVPVIVLMAMTPSFVNAVKPETMEMNNDPIEMTQGSCSRYGFPLKEFNRFKNGSHAKNFLLNNADDYYGCMYFNGETPRGNMWHAFLFKKWHDNSCINVVVIPADFKPGNYKDKNDEAYKLPHIIKVVKHKTPNDPHRKYYYGYVVRECEKKVVNGVPYDLDYEIKIAGNWGHSDAVLNLIGAQPTNVKTPKNETGIKYEVTDNPNLQPPKYERTAEHLFELLLEDDD